MSYEKVRAMIDYVDALPKNYQFDYSIPCRCLFGYGLEKVSNQSILDYIEKFGPNEMFAPLGEVLEITAKQADELYRGLEDLFHWGSRPTSKSDICKLARKAVKQWEYQDYLESNKILFNYEFDHDLV